MKNRYCLILALILGACFSAYVEAQPQVFRNSRIESSVSALGNGKWKIRLSAKDRWFDTNISVVEGAAINISATGYVNWGTPPGDENTPFRVGPNGTRPPYPDDKHRFPMPDAGCGSLIMRVGNSIYSVGEGGSIKIEESGTIQLMVNDDFLSDNSDNFFVNIEAPQSYNSYCNNSTNQKVSALIPYGSDNGKKTPLILIHGIHGTTPDEKLIEANQYWNEFKAKFVADKDLMSKYVIYDFQYHSNQKSVQDISCELGLSIDEKIPDRRHVILAHSMGGLVAKAYMVFYSHENGEWSGMKGGETVLGAITLATPHHGTHGSNDVNALGQHIKFGWKRVISSLNFSYWSSRTEFFSPQTLDSGMPNRGDLRWDNYDNAIGKNSLTNNDVNVWLPVANKKFEQFASKVTLYAGEMDLKNMTNSPRDALSTIKRNPLYDEHQQLSFANYVLVNGFSNKFGFTDGLVPYKSALLCDTPPYLTSSTTPNFICGSKYKVRRFEAGNADVPANQLPDTNTRSIKRISRGYDHKDMYEHPDILHYVISDLKDFVENKIPYPSTKTKIYKKGNLFQLNVPDNWQAFETGDTITFAPPGAYGDYGITHGAMIGNVQTRSNSLMQATEEYVNSVLQSNNYLRQNKGYSPASIGGRNAYVTTLSGHLPITGKTEIVTLYTTRLRNGNLFYVMLVSPEDESSRYSSAFSNLIRSINLNPSENASNRKIHKTGI